MNNKKSFEDQVRDHNRNLAVQAQKSGGEGGSARPKNPSGGAAKKMSSRLSGHPNVELSSNNMNLLQNS